MELLEYVRLLVLAGIQVRPVILFLSVALVDIGDKAMVVSA